MADELVPFTADLAHRAPPLDPPVLRRIAASVEHDPATCAMCRTDWTQRARRVSPRSLWQFLTELWP